ncbi:MAG: biopolymer transporter ExbD [Gammaproteobacteria bacterium]|nr:biopolymer transporter ExbD [Gammaproteobacteria bacterium]
MKASKHVQRVRRHHARHRRGDLNILPMIDMMVILVFFLIFTAVFSKTSILELDLPAGDASVPELPQGLQLEVIVRDASIDVADRATGPLRSLPNLAAGYDLQGLAEYLKLVKGRFPDKQDVTILLDPAIPYDVLVQVMDTVRIYEVPGSNGWARVELFPNIAVGDAPT